jgi:predicted metal-dependent enzyme (double-stranded beta helix superfamily)
MFDLDTLVNDCRAALAEPAPPIAVRDVVQRAISEPARVDAALGDPGEGGIRTLHHAADLTILQIVWPPRVELFPHDHRMWATIGVYGGVEENTFYRRGDHGVAVAGGRDLHAGDVLVLGDEAVHSVRNPRRSPTVAIHVYGGDFFAVPRSQFDPETLVESPFDFETVTQLMADAVARAHGGD